MTLTEHQRRRRGELTARTPENIAAIIELTEDGWTATAIGRHLGMSARVVERARCELDVHPPEPFVDEMAVARAIDGDRSVRLNTLETTEAIRQLTERGHSSPLIARRLGISERTVNRHRAKLRESS